ncbi:hypothetical protein N0V82_001892 [Gnomoniopsis sp. IMI 355080]|nr:hypothetical protein N0V82_001892 [Gnomoniopsis sp. IMI 355080]
MFRTCTKKAAKMSNLTLSMALARNAKTTATNSAQQESPMTPVTPVTPIDGRPQAVESDKENVPEFAHTIPAIFVPLRHDLLTPIEPAKDRVERLQRMQASLDANELAVRDNLALMFEREARRRVAHAKKTRDFSEPHQPEVIDWDEGDMLIERLTAPANPGQSHHVRPETLAEWDQAKIQHVAPGQMPPHEHTAREVLFVANNGSQEIRDYSAHIGLIRDKMKKSLERADGV